MSIGTLRSLESQVGELVERHESGRDLSEFTRYEPDPIGFIREVLKAEPWSAQVEIAEAVRDHPLTVVRSCNSMGKDWLAARLAMWWVYARGGLCLITGPSERQIKGIIFREIRSAFSQADLFGELFELALRVDRNANVGIVGFTASGASALQGWHSGRVLAIITEAQGVEGFAYEAMHACTTGPDDRMLALGNPLHPSGEFYASTRRASWHSIRVSAGQHPNVVEGRQVIAGGVSRSFVDRMASEYGETSSIYRSRVLAEFPEFAEQGLISRAWLERAAELYRTGAFAAESATAEPIVSVDPARYGADSTAVMVRRGQRITHSTKWGQVSLTETAERLIKVLDAEGIRPKAGERPTRMLKAHGRIIVDGHGLGSGLIDRLREYGYQVEEFLGMRRQKGGKFLNARAVAFWELRELLENERLALEWDPDLVEELLSVEWSTPTGAIQIVSKDKIKQLIGRSPDMADALSQATYSIPDRSARVQTFRI